MKPKNCLIFGASGQIGRHLIRKLTKNNYKVTAVTRNLHQKAYLLKTQANAGYLDIVETNIVNETKLIDLIRKTDICINLIGILFEKGKFNTFNNIHNIFPSLISKLCKDHNVEQFIHLSALGIENSYESTYAKSKLDGESNIKKNFNKSVILRPSVVFSVDDNFTTKFMPIHCSDLTEVIYQIINKKIISTTIECVGPETISLKNILERLLKMIDKKRLLIPVPLFIAKINAIFFQIFPKPIITLDQLKLLNYDNIASGKYKTNFDLGVPSIHKFDTEVSKYSYMWKEAGEFSKKNGKHIN